MAFQTAARYDAGEDVRHDSYMCKYFGDESSFAASDRCLQIHGGIGLTTDYPLRPFGGISAASRSPKDQLKF